MYRNHHERGYIALIALTIGLIVALYLMIEYSPMGKGANDATLSRDIEAKVQAQAIQELANQRDEEYRRQMND
jgi:hypothetical protein